MATTTVGEFEGIIAITSNDPLQPVFTFIVRGVVAGGRVVILITNPDNTVDRVIVSNEDIDLGVTNINVGVAKTFGIENLSDMETIIIYSITIDNNRFEVTNIPLSIEPGEVEEFTVSLNATEVGQFRANVIVSTSINDFSFAVTGEVVSEGDPPLTIYNVVTPNADGVHDTFKVVNIESYPNSTISIFNRWGGRVWETSNYDNDINYFYGLDSNGSELDTGNYYYVIDKGNGDQPERGFLFLKR